MADQRFDVILVGAGTGGLFLAWLLGRRGLSVLLVDRGAGLHSIPRGEILQPNGLAILDRFGLLDSVKSAAYRAERFEFLTTGRMPLCTVEYGLLPPPYSYGLIALPEILQEALLSRVSSLPGVRVVWSGAFCGVDRDGKGLRVRVKEQGRENDFSCRVLVGADGPRSAVRAALGIAARVHDYRDGYLTLVCPRPPGFESQGRYYLGRREILGAFPVSDKALYLFYMIARRRLNTIRLRGIDALKAAISAIDPSTAGPLEAISSFDQVRFMPCVRVRARTWVSDHAALIGDAVHAMNPHVAQGTNQALEDGSVLSEILFDCFERGEFHAGALSVYETARRGKAEALQRLGDEMTFFWNRGLPLAWVRDRVFRTIARDAGLRRKMVATVAGVAVAPYTWADRFSTVGIGRGSGSTA